MTATIFAHISDLHVPFEPRLTWSQRLSKRQLSAWSWHRRRHLQRPEILDALAADLRTAGIPHIAVTGDITNFSLPAEFEAAAQWLKRLEPADISLVPGNHDALVPVEGALGLDHWSAWTRLDEQSWPFVHEYGEVVLIGVNTAQPTAPALARGRVGAAQRARLEALLMKYADRCRVLLLHHPLAEQAVGRRKALSDRREMRELLKRVGAELVLHGHARDARFDPVPGPVAPIPCICVPSSSALPNPRDEGARWHRLEITRQGDGWRVAIEVRRWSVEQSAFVTAGGYVLCLPRQWP